MRTRARSFLPCVFSLCTLLSGCATTGPGRLDPDIVRAAATLSPVDVVIIQTDRDGAVDKLAVYHHSQERVSPAVQQLAKTRFPGATIRRYELERYRDKGWVHEVEVETAEGKRCEVSATVAGQLVYVECQIPPAELPQPIAQAVTRLVPGGEIVEAETHEGGPTEGKRFSIEVKGPGGLHYLRFREGGELIRHSLRVPALLEVPVP